MKYQTYFALDKLMKINRLSERELALAAKVSRACLRHIADREHNVTVESICSVAKFLGGGVEIVVSTQTASSEFCTVATAYKVERDGFESWKIHYMDLIDEFRRSLDPRLVLLAPPRSLEIRLTALMASLVCYLCQEAELPIPAWANKRYYLASPWFVSGMESLKATAIMESPMAFRANNIFVHENFASRA